MGARLFETSLRRLCAGALDDAGVQMDVRTIKVKACSVGGIHLYGIASGCGCFGTKCTVSSEGIIHDEMLEEIMF